jgi:hypothetical protein
MKKGAWANIPPKSNRSDPICFSPYLYRARNQVERFFNRIKHNVVVWRRAMTGLLPTALLSFNSRQSGSGCVFMSPRPNQPQFQIGPIGACVQQGPKLPPL